MRRPERSMVKIYKDLMITRRDLIDLRTSISNTLETIKQSDVQLKKIEDQRKSKPVPQPKGLFQKVPTSPITSFKCSICEEGFSKEADMLYHFSKEHEICPDCK